MNDFSQSAVFLLILIPLASSALSLIEKGFSGFRVSRISVPLSLLACGVVLVFILPFVTEGKELLYELGGWPEPYGIVLYMDGFAWLGSLAVLSVALPVSLYAAAENIYSPTFYFIFLIMIAGMEGLLLTGDIFNMFVFFEILALCSYVLIAYLKKPRAVVASFKYLLVSTLGIVFFLVGVLILYRITGTLSLRRIGGILSGLGSSAPGIQAGIAVICIFTGIGVRAAFIPFHGWLPEAHAHAPHPVSAMLSGVMIKVSFLALWRVISLFGAGYAEDLLIVVGAFTAFLGVIWALSQTDVKKLLAYHSISQMGYIIAAFGAGTAISRTASFLHLFNHALFKSLLFLSAGVVISVAGERDIKKLKGAGARFPWAALPFAAAALSIAGIPPWNGFVSKSLVSLALESHWTYPLVYLAGAGTVASFVKLSAIFRRGRNYTAPEGLPKDGPSRWIYPPLWLLAAACLAGGTVPGFVLPRIAGLLGENSAGNAFPAVYGSVSLGKTAITVIAGLFVYFLVTSRRGTAAAERIRAASFGLSGALMLIPAGFLLFALYFLRGAFL